MNTLEKIAGYPAQWYAVQTKPKQESMACHSLDQVAIETFYPQIGSKKSLFNSYIFAKFCITRHVRCVKFAHGVHRIVGFGPEASPVAVEILDAIRSRIVDGYVKLEFPAFRKGERVCVQDGLMAGLRGIFDRRIKDTDRIVLLLEMISGQSRIVLPAHLVRKVS